MPNFTSRLSLEDEVLVITVHDPVTTDQRAALTDDLHTLITSHAPAGVVISLTPRAGTTPAASVVLRLSQHCARAGLPLAVATPAPAVRRLINANQPSLPVHGHTDDALQAARHRRH
ncbi:hypothetical protein [Streptomyces sp. NPDC097619]|uniref:hypothetical protein n=1 Tax=Streptomyces sp. NPDC097619 TaxID=3157228 RepID=UPI0033344C4A